MRFATIWLSAILPVHSYWMSKNYIKGIKTHDVESYSRLNAVAESAFASLITGGLAGSVGVGAAYPFDSIKVSNAVPYTFNSV